MPQKQSSGKKGEREEKLLGKAVREKEHGERQGMLQARRHRLQRRETERLGKEKTAHQDHLSQLNERYGTSVKAQPRHE